MVKKITFLKLSSQEFKELRSVAFHPKSSKIVH